MYLQEGHEIPAADNGAKVMQLTQVKFAHIVSSAVSQALTQQIQQIGNNPPPATAANHVPQNTTAVQQVQPLVNFDVPTFEGDSATIWLTCSQRVVYQARACGFEAELTAAELEDLSVGADVFDRSNVDPVRLRNAHLVWITLMNSCREVVLEIVQRSKISYDAKGNLESHYIVKETRETFRLSLEVERKTRESGGDPFKIMTEIDGLVENLHRLGDRSRTEKMRDYRGWTVR